MAWLLKQSSTSLRYLPKITATPACPDYQTVTAYREQHGFHPTGIHSAGNFLEDRFWPVSGQFKNDLKLVPRLLGLCGFYLIPDSWRQVIEEFEPGVHQFKHIPLTLKDGSPLEERYYAMNIRQALRDVADRERSTAPYKVYGNGTGAFVKTSNSYNAKVYFGYEKVKSVHLWQPLDVITYKIAMSNELYDQISSLGGMKTIQTLEIEEV